MRSSLPLRRLSVLLSWFSLFATSGDTGLVGILRNPGVFGFPELTKIGWHRRWSDDSQRAGTEGTRGKKVQRPGRYGFFLANKPSTSNTRQDTTRRFKTHTTPQHHKKKNNQQPWDCVFSCSVCLCWSFLLLGTGTGDDISAFLFFPGVWKHTRKLGVGTTTHHSD